MNLEDVTSRWFLFRDIDIYNIKLVKKSIQT